MNHRLMKAVFARPLPPRGADGVYDFVEPAARTEERRHYDRVYLRAPAASRRPLDELDAAWRYHGCPELDEIRRRVGDVRGKRVLLVGNGASEKELLLLKGEPELLIYSDLSPHGIARIRAGRDLTGFEDRVVFAAIDAQDLPLRDRSVDLVCGFAFAHHLPDVGRFLGEVARVLKPGGRAIFSDDAYSPVWHAAKRTVLRPVMAYSHTANGISPEDYRFSMAGGFREEDLARLVEQHGGRPWFQRSGFLHYLWMRGAQTLLPRAIRGLAAGPAPSGLVWSVDRALCRVPALSRQQVRLLWGLDMPA